MLRILVEAPFYDASRNGYARPVSFRPAHLFSSGFYPLATLRPFQAMYVISSATSIHVKPLLPYAASAFGSFFASRPAKAVFAQLRV